MNKLGWIITIFFIAVILTVTVMGYVQFKTLKCEIGKPEIIGDYLVTAKFMITNAPVASKDCEVRDCLAFNDYQKLNGGKGRCIVS